jgi:hypothetical protein
MHVEAFQFLDALLRSLVADVLFVGIHSDLHSLAAVSVAHMLAERTTAAGRSD